MCKVSDDENGRFPCLTTMVGEIDALLDPYAFAAACLPNAQLQCRTDLSRYDSSLYSTQSWACDDAEISEGDPALALVANGEGGCQAGLFMHIM